MSLFPIFLRHYHGNDSYIVKFGLYKKESNFAFYFIFNCKAKHNFLHKFPTDIWKNMNFYKVFTFVALLMAILVGQSEAGWLKKLGKSIVSIFDIMSLVLPEKIVIVYSVAFRYRNLQRFNRYVSDFAYGTVRRRSNQFIHSGTSPQMV